MQLFDTHLHLDDTQFDPIRADVVSRADQAGVQKMLAVGTTADSSRATVALAGSFQSVYAAVGIQPNCCAAAENGDWDKVCKLVEEPKVIALGETGLDRYWDDTPFEMQQDYFDRHLRLAQETKLPFIVHMRDCGPDVVLMLAEARQRGPLRGVMHSFTGDADLAAQCLELGLFISFAGMVTFKKSTDLRAVARQIPANRILIETDAPYLSPHPHRAVRPNEPAQIVHTANCIAAERRLSGEEFAKITYQNACDLFDVSSVG
ncbi:MAG: TatD family hydrolase [Pirellulaceae bacterium]|nr:TatD family hydrolase [Pirellulaceae bacterium]